MTAENVALVRAVYSAWNHRDGDDQMLAFLADDFEFVNPNYAVEPGVRRGHAGWWAVIKSLDDAFDDYHHELVETHDLGDRVLCFTTFVARTNADSVALRQSEEHIWTLRDGKITRLEWFHNRAEALAAAGLSE
jgi:ketosteroid isomerase-like protein